MDFLNQTFAQVGDLFRSMTPAARITTALLLVVVVVSLGYLFSGQVSGPDTDLMNGVPVVSSHLPAMEAAFDAAGLRSYTIRGTQILVPAGQKAAYMAALADAGALPPNINTVFDEALKDSGMFMSRQEREERLKIAKQKMLGMIIGSMKGIESAYVLYDTEIKGGLQKQKIITASVSVKPAAAEPLTDGQVSTIRHLVASAISTDPQRVTIADTAGLVHYGNPENGGSAGDNVYVALKRIHEHDFQGKILNALAYVPGVSVTANVILSQERVNRKQSVKHDPKPVDIQKKDESISRVAESAAPAGQPGFLAQGNTPTALRTSYNKGSSETTEESKSEVNSLTNVEQIEVETEPLTPKQVSVSIAIPSSYFEKVWKERNPAADPSQPPKAPTQADLDKIRDLETTSIRDLVANLLPDAEGVTDKTELVKIATFQDIAPAEAAAPGMADNAIVWLGQYWATAGMIGVALFSLVMLRSMVRAAPSGPERGVGPRIAVADEERNESEAAKPAQSRLKRFAGSGTSLRDELSQLVQEDPDAAANILRTWIGKVG